MFIVVGLGNPGREYARTRHNVGFDVIDVLSEKHHIQLTKNAMHGQIGEGFVGGEKLVLVSPQTFMNLSGQCVTELVSYGRRWITCSWSTTTSTCRWASCACAKRAAQARTTACARSSAFWAGRIFRGCASAWAKSRRAGSWPMRVLSRYQTEADRKTQFDAFLRAADVVDDLMKNGLESAMRMANAPA